MSERKRQSLYIGVAGLVVALSDQLSKTIVRATIEAPTPRREDVFFHFAHHQNTGLVGGMFSDVPFIAYVAPPLATLLLLYLARYLDPRSVWQNVAYGMVLGGAVGNFIDRIRFQAVTDFLQFHLYFIPFDFPWKYWPAFNLADASICVGVAILILTWNTMEKKERRASNPV